jgi:mRNA-degrading endonuclease RelE of RelBE toxin-antitoxin system
MKGFRRAPAFIKDFARLPRPIQDAFWKQLELLMRNPHHPSLNVKKMKGAGEIWRANVTDGYRFTFEIAGDHCLLRRVGTHDVMRTP